MKKRFWFEITFFQIVGILLVGCGPSKDQLATQTAIAATATFEALPTSTSTQTLTDIPTSTLTPTKTPIPTKTETVTPTNFPDNWKDAFFIPVEKEQELRDKGAIILTDLPVEQWKDLKITGPGQVYVDCNGKRMKNSMPKSSYLSEIKIDRMHYGNAVCIVGAYTEQELRDVYEKKAPSANAERIQQLTDKYIRLSKAMYSQLPDDYFYLDAYLALDLWINPEYIDDLNWLLLSVSNEDNSLDAYIKTILLPNS